MALVFLLVLADQMAAVSLILTAPFSLAAAQGLRKGVYEPAGSVYERLRVILRHPDSDKLACIFPERTALKPCRGYCRV